MNIATDRIVSRVKGANPWTISLAVFLLVLFVVLAVRASDEYRWSDWGFGDAQTMLSLKQWEEGGWIHNYLLFKPQGYAKVVDLLDEPELRHHAHGTCPGSSPRVGPRLWYTHYPAGYLIPYAALFKVGLTGIFSARMLSLVFSFGALILMYVLFAKLTSPRISVVAVAFYALSASFLGYADSLANQPIDDLLRFGFMLAVVLSARTASNTLQKRWMIAAWIMEFALSLSSFDSVFFVYAWLIGWDILEKRGFRWKTYLLFALAPASAHSLQFLQNVWYLGWHDAFIDIKDAFLLKNGADAGYNLGQGRLATILVSLLILSDNLFSPGWLIAVVVIAYLLYRRFAMGQDRELPKFRVLLLLFLCGLPFVFILPHAARMPYEARQMIPFMALLASAFTWSVLKSFKRGIHGEQATQQGGTVVSGQRFIIPYLFISSVLLLVFWFRFAYSDRTPVYTIPPDMTDIPFAEQLKTFPAQYGPVFFDAGGFQKFWDPTYVPGYPQILPLTEYYAGSRPILCFTDSEKLARDITTMVRKSGSKFSPVIISSRTGTFEDIIAILKREDIFTGVPPNIYFVMDRYVIDLTNNIKWGKHEADTDSGKP